MHRIRPIGLLHITNFIRSWARPSSGCWVLGWPRCCCLPPAPPLLAATAFVVLAFSQIAADSVEARIAGLAVPALIVWGEQDRALHVGSAQRLHTLVPRSAVILMPSVGHLPMIERPWQSADDYLRFRASLPS